MTIEYNTPDKPGSPDGAESDDKGASSPASDNSGTMIIDATYAPQNTEF